MQESQNKGFKHCSCTSLILSMITSTIFVIGVGVNNSAVANSFEPSETPASAAASCPADHKMYYIGANPPSATIPVTSQALSWETGEVTKTFTFAEASGNKTFKIIFSSVRDLNNTFGTPPIYGNLNGVTTSAINLIHNSPVSNASRTNHILDVAINRPTSKVGYKIQDVDSVTIGLTTPYIEQIDASASNGKLNYNSNFQTINPANNIVTGRRGLNCGTGECTIDANWNYTLADIALNLKHINTLSEINSPHAVGYSDFYFCLAPPKVIVKKALNDSRVNSNDQFEISTKDGTTTLNTFSTTGSNATITNGTSVAQSLKENKSYTITERVLNGGNISNYNANYVCTNATTGSTTVMPTSAMTYSAANSTRSFTLTNVTYGDEVTCTITNSANYVFSGIVFNDNGNVLNPSKDDISSKYLNNSLYFNGKYDSGTESGIPFTSGHTITLNKCVGDTSGSAFTSQTVDINTDGTYSFNLTPAQVGTNTKLCTTQNEPSNYTYSVDTTSNTRQIDIANNKYNYPNNDFGDVTQENAPLILKKAQYVHNCNANLSYTATAINQSTNDAKVGFSSEEARDVGADQCIAYRITAYNRGHLELKNIQITDPLQSSKSKFFNPLPIGTPTSIYTGTTLPTNSSITSNLFDLAAASNTSATQATLYFNTKYDTTGSN